MAEGESKKDEGSKKRPEEEESAELSDEEGGQDAMRERLLRLAAEFDNYKKRMSKQVEGAKELGKAEIITKILPSIDEFELALSSKSSDGDHLKGMEMVYSNLMGTLKSCGLTPIDSVGKSDPYKHEIILARESEKPEGTILEVVRKGYMFNSIMIRPASVVVSKGADRKTKQEDDNKKSENKGE